MATLNNTTLLALLWQAPLPTYLHILNINLGGTDAITLFDDSSHHRITGNLEFSSTTLHINKASFKHKICGITIVVHTVHSSSIEEIRIVDQTLESQTTAAMILSHYTSQSHTREHIIFSMTNLK